MRCFILLFLLVPVLGMSQTNSKFKELQKKIDNQHAGIGFEFYKPRFGKRIIVNEPWVDFNMLTSCFEAKVGFGEIELPEPVLGFNDEYVAVYKGRKAFGSHLYFGINAPFTGLRLGAQNSSIMKARFHPVITWGIGGYRTWEYNSDKQSTMYYSSLGFGARLRLPLATLEAGINWGAGFSTGDHSDEWRYHTVKPYIVIRFDGRKQRLDPRMVTVGATAYHVENFNSKTTKSTGYSTVNGKTYKTETTTTYSSADVVVNKTKVGLEDIGPFFGIGPKLSINNYRRRHYIPATTMFGAVATGRAGWMVMNLTFEGGKLGHGTTLEGESWKEQVDDNDDFGAGTLKVNQFYFDLGLDISPALTAMLGLVRDDDGSVTTFNAVTAGWSIGHAIIGDQAFANAGAGSQFDALLLANPDVAPELIDPRASGSGRVQGWYLGVEIGVVAFRMQRLKYKNAPLANNTYYSLIYRFPLGR